VKILLQILEVLGGTTVVIAALALFFNNIIRDWLKQHWKKESDLELEKAKVHGKITTIQPQQFVGDQYDIYIKLWRSLAGLQAAVDALWKSASRRNALLLAKHLRVVQKNIKAWSLFFEDQHLRQLKNAIHVLQDFHAGKIRLYELRNATDLDSFPADFVASTIQQQISQNYEYKTQFETLLEEIRQSFQRKLTGRAKLYQDDNS
jgi:hypothetical protein